MSREAQRAIALLMTLFSLFVQSFVYTFLLYLLAWITKNVLDIRIDSWFEAFVMASTIAVVIPVVLLIELLFVLLECWFYWFPSVIFSFVSKVINVLFIVFLVQWCDNVVNGVELSHYAEIVYGFLVFLVLEWMVIGVDVEEIEIEEK